MRVAENEIAQDVLAGKTIILEVIPKYPGDSPIPNEIQISASDGKTSKTWIIPPV